MEGVAVVTGAAGFIGSHLVERLLHERGSVVGLDNLSTGCRSNLDQVRTAVGEADWNRFTFIEADVRDAVACRRACRAATVVFHQAALGSVPRSIADPLESHEANVTGTLNMLTAARDEGVSRFVYASSSSVYGDDAELPKVEPRLGRPLSPYAATKRAGELYADAFARVYGLAVVGLRYFNVFGPRQDREGPYAAVIPRWFEALWQNGRPTIYGDGETSRDFCYVSNAVEANLQAATIRDPAALGEVYNVAAGRRTSLNTLYSLIRDRVARARPAAAMITPVHAEPRAGDVRHSVADLTKATDRLGFVPNRTLEEGLDETAGWFEQRMSAEPAPRRAI